MAAAETAVACPRILVARIQAHVADHYRIPRAEMKSDHRYREVARPRQVAMYLSKCLTLRRISEIGHSFGRDHSTVIHAVRQIEKLRAEDSALDADIRLLTKQLVGGGQ